MRRVHENAASSARGAGRRLLVLVAASALVAASCQGQAPGDSGDSADSKKVLRVAVFEEITDLNVGFIGLAVNEMHQVNIFNGLVTYDPETNEIVPDLAEDFTVSDDGLTYTFNLREGVQFHHGYGELTAEDVKATFEWVKDPKNARGRGEALAIIKEVTAVDDYTVEIHLNEVSASFLDLLAYRGGLITSGKALDELGEELASKPVGTGPFYFDEWARGERTVLKAHEDYFGDPPAIEELRFQIIPEEQVALQALERGEVDVVPISQFPAYRSAQQSDEVNVQSVESGWNNMIFLRADRKPTDDPLVRQALAHAIDLEAFPEAFEGFVSVNPSFLSPITFSWTDDLPVYEYDPDRARELLAEAGYSDPADVNVELVFNDAYLFEDNALIVRDFWNELGVNVKLTEFGRADWLERFQQDPWNAGSLSLARWEPNEFSSLLLQSESPLNFSKWSNPEADRLISEASVERDPQAREELYVQLQELVATELPLIPIGAQPAYVALADGLEGVQPTAFNGVVLFGSARFE